MMKSFEGLVVLGITALLIAACALPVGEDYTISRKDEVVINYVTAYDLQNYVPIPQAGDKPVRNLTSRLDLTVKTEWRVEQPAGSGTFESIPAALDYTFVLGTVYQAVITLQTNSRYQFAENIDFAYTPGMVNTLEKGDSGAKARTFTITYKATKQPTVVSDRNLTLYIPKPAAGVLPVVSFGGGQYTGTVVWKKAVGDVVLSGPFQLGVAYKAEVTLSPRVGYTLTGLGAASFSHTETNTTVYDTTGGIIRITFSPATYFINLVECFGPVGQKGSALALLKEHCADFYPLVIKLPPNLEEAIAGFTLAAEETSPTNVIIDGQGGKLKIQKAGDLMTVGDGVTLILKDIKVEGLGTNNSPLFKVLHGGKLILDKGVVLADNTNTSSGDVGGVWVNGGFLKLRDGAAIKGMEGKKAGGVRMNKSGRFIMEGGTIGGEDPKDANKSTGNDGAGGVQIESGFFEMQGGTIQRNTATGGKSGGGVYVGKERIGELGFFEMQGGTIQRNTATGNNSGNGVYIWNGTFSMSGDARVATNNPVYLVFGSCVTVGGNLSAETAANLICDSTPDIGTTELLQANSEALITANRTKFLYNNQPNHINEKPLREFKLYYGVYQ